MSPTVQNLLNEIESLPEPADLVAKHSLSLAKDTARAIASVLGKDTGRGDTAARKQVFESLKTMAPTAMQVELPVQAKVVLQKLHAIVLAVADGKPEPTEAELTSRFDKQWWQFWK